MIICPKIGNNWLNKLINTGSTVVAICPNAWPIIWNAGISADNIFEPRLITVLRKFSFVAINVTKPAANKAIAPMIRVAGLNNPAKALPRPDIPFFSRPITPPLDQSTLKKFVIAGITLGTADPIPFVMTLPTVNT